MQSIHVNPVSPQALVMTCTPSNALPDMTQVQSSVLVLADPNGLAIELSATISAQSPSSLTLTHLFAPGEVVRVGTYSVYPVHTIATGTIRGSTQQFQSTAQFS